MSAARLEELRERALGIGADPADSSDERFRKRLLVGIALIILPAGLVWGYLYWVADELGVALRRGATSSVRSSALRSSLAPGTSRS